MLLRGSSAILCVLLAPCALAEDLPPVRLGAPVSLTLDLTGRIATRCGFATAPAVTANFGDLAATGSLALPFKLDCNTPFEVKVASSNGALARSEPIDAPAPYTAKLDYAIALSVDTDLATVAAQCMAGALTASSCALGAGLSSGDGVGIGTAGSLTLSWTPPVKTLVAGSYRDQITLTVEVRS